MNDADTDNLTCHSLTLDRLKDVIASVDWFSQLGTHPVSKDNLVIRSLAAGSATDAWDWLPTIGTENETKYSRPILEVIRLQGREAELNRICAELYKLLLRSQRQIPDAVPQLKVGASNVTPAAKGAAKFAFRMAAAEIVAERRAFWCSLIPIYAQGNWPCGIADDGKIVVF